MKISTNCSSLVILGDFFPPFFFSYKTNELPSRELGDLYEINK